MPDIKVLRKKQRGEIIFAWVRQENYQKKVTHFFPNRKELERDFTQPGRRSGKGVWRIEFILERRNNRSKGKMARMCTVLMEWQEMPHDLRMGF